METNSSLFPGKEIDHLSIIQHLKTLKNGGVLQTWNQVDAAIQEYAYLKNCVAKLQDLKQKEIGTVEEKYALAIEKLTTVMEQIDDISRAFCLAHTDQFVFTTNGDKTLPHGCITLSRETRIKMKAGNEPK
jgi:phage host-nuclease inhibitor protein Gam